MISLEESGASKHLRSTAFEMALFGTGVMKGPFAVDKEYPNWDEEVNTTLSLKLFHKYLMYLCGTFIPIQMLTNMDEAQYVIERHKMSRTQMRRTKDETILSV